MIKDYLNLIFRQIKKKKLRSFLTVIGIVISIATIFVLISLSLGFNEAVEKQFETLGTNKLFIQPKGQIGYGSKGAVELTTKDVEVINKINGVELATYAVIGNAKIEANKKTRYYMVIGIPDDEKALKLMFEASGVKIEEGRFFKKNEKKKIILGYDYKYKELFGKNMRVKDKIKLNDVEFEVVGILTAIGNSQDDQQVYISYEDFKELFNSKERVDVIWVEVKKGEDINEIAERIKRRLMNYRGVNEKTIDFYILTPEEILKTFKNILNIVTIFLVGIAMISLLIGGIGIANTMYTAVLERTKEIGIMKAIGAKNSDILFIFVIESGIFGLIGGLIGILFGIGIGKIIDIVALSILQTNLLKTAITKELIFGCLIFSFFVGVISGYFPARHASKIKPVDSLRYE